MILNDSKTGVVILGMHRSGTSLLIGLLEQFGYQLGDVSTQTSKFKPTGTKENLALRKINNEILYLNKCSWDKPKKNLILNETISVQIKNISLTNKPQLKWAIKDPRMVLTYNLWQPYLADNKLIATIRSPKEVVWSLYLKNNLAISQGVDLWYFYNKLILQYWKEFKFPILNFNLDKQSYYKQFHQLSHYLDIESDKERFDQFYQHKAIPTDFIKNVNINPSVIDLYNELLDISMNNRYAR
jgi:hypothetical protein